MGSLQQRQNRGRRTVGAALLALAISTTGCHGERPVFPASLVQTFGAPSNLGALVNTPANEQRPSLSPDGLSLFFGSDRPGSVGTVEHSDLYVLQRRSLHNAWGPPRRVDVLSSVGDDNAITFSNDGRLIFFGSDRPGGCGGTDIWSARRADPHDDFAWEAAVNLGCTINSPQDDDGPTYFEAPSGEKTLTFCSFNRPAAVAAGFGDWDIYEVRGADVSAFGAATLVASVSSKARDTRTALRSDGLELLFTSSRPGSLGKKDLWSAIRVRLDADWATPVNLGAPINVPEDDGAPALARDGRTLYFDSDRSGGQGGRDLYVATALRR
jgi:WD40-like Beta Propeller Repeat